MHVCMNVCMYTRIMYYVCMLFMYVCVCICVMYVCIYVMYLCIYVVYVCMYECMHVYSYYVLCMYVIYVCMCVYICYVYMYICYVSMYICYVCTNVCMYTRIMYQGQVKSRHLAGNTPAACLRFRVRFRVWKLGFVTVALRGFPSYLKLYCTYPSLGNSRLFLILSNLLSCYEPIIRRDIIRGKEVP